MVVSIFVWYLWNGHSHQWHCYGPIELSLWVWKKYFETWPLGDNDDGGTLSDRRVQREIFLNLPSAPSQNWPNIQFVKLWQKIWAGVSPPPLPIPKLIQYTVCENWTKIWAGPPPPHLDKIQKNSNFFRETVPKELWENTPGSPWHIWCRNGSRGSRPEGPEWRPPSPPPPCSWQKDWAPTGKSLTSCL